MYYFHNRASVPINTTKIVWTQFGTEHRNMPVYENDAFPDGFLDELVWDDHKNLFDDKLNAKEYYGRVRIL